MQDFGSNAMYMLSYGGRTFFVSQHASGGRIDLFLGSDRTMEKAPGEFSDVNGNRMASFYAAPGEYVLPDGSRVRLYGHSDLDAYLRNVGAPALATILKLKNAQPKRTAASGFFDGPDADSGKKPDSPYRQY